MSENEKKTIGEQMLEILRDGKPHPKSELHDLCRPSGPGAVRVHIYNLRRSLKQGFKIVTVYRNGGLCYQLVRVLASPYDGRI